MSWSSGWGCASVSEPVGKEACECGDGRSHRRPLDEVDDDHHSGGAPGAMQAIEGRGGRTADATTDNSTNHCCDTFCGALQDRTDSRDAEEVEDLQSAGGERGRAVAGVPHAKDVDEGLDEVHHTGRARKGHHCVPDASQQPALRVWEPACGPAVLWVRRDWRLEAGCGGGRPGRARRRGRTGWKRGGRRL